jgi:hypothetical protein
LIGGIPLLAAIPAVWRSFHGRGAKDRARDLIWPRRRAPATATTSWGTDGRFHGASASSGPSAATPSTAWVDPGAPDAVVSALERLEALHRSGALSDAQFEEAKQRVLGNA